MTSATPNTPSYVDSTPIQVKVATPDLILFKDDVVPIETMTDLLFENISSQEIISIVRNDIINGQDVSYSPIKNLSYLSIKYSPTNIISMQSSIFNNYPIKLEDRVPTAGSGVGGLHVFTDSNNSLVIEVENMEDDERVEVQVLTSGSVIDDTIYGD